VRVDELKPENLNSATSRVSLLSVVLLSTRRYDMAEFDLTQGRWRFHQSLGIATPPTAMDAPRPDGSNTDVLLYFTVQDPGFTLADPPPSGGALMAVHETRYRGFVALQEDPLDNDFQLGHLWAKVLPGTHDSFDLVHIIREGFALPATPITNGELPVRIYTGRYTLPGGYFAGYGADNWAGSGGLFTFTLTPENVP